jgi:glutathione synthase/RimK-type ligase-like ATP-grasp enzyme
MNADVTIVTHAAIPDGCQDDRLLAAAFAEKRIGTRFAVWDESSVDWRLTPTAVVRSTWDYHLKPAAWLQWLKQIEMQTRLINTASLIEWNSEKHYLDDLMARGIPRVPTEFVTRNSCLDLAEIAERRNWPSLIVKPTISASAHGALRFDGHSIADAGQSHPSMLLRSGNAMVQPFLTSVITDLERSIVLINGEIISAFTKPAFNTNSAGKMNRPGNAGGTWVWIPLPRPGRHAVAGNSARMKL